MLVIANILFVTYICSTTQNTIAIIIAIAGYSR